MVNNLLSVWGTIGSVLLAILILLIMITVHEFGHWVAGKILKFKIDEFSIGFGPALFKKKKKNGEVFSLRLIPLGGYCSFHGEDGLEEEERLPEPFPETQEEPIAAEPQNASPAAEPSPEAKKKRRTPEWKSKPDDGSFTRKAPWKRLIVLVAGAFMNYVLALVVIMICFFAYGQTMIEVSKVAVSEEFPQEYSLRDGDVLLEANGKKLYFANDVALALNGKKAGEEVSLRVSRIIGTKTDDQGETVNVREVREITVKLRSDVTVKSSADTDCIWGALGAEYLEGEDGSGGYALGYRLFRFGFFETGGRSFVYSFKIAGSVLRVLGELLTGRLGLSAFGGPVTTIAMTSRIASANFRSFLEISGFIGVNLAVFNLLPIPALDGSKFVFTVIEWIRGKPISRKIEAIIHAAGFIFLLGFAVLVDILQFV
ncbi:MAG: M50 family metallopeptidase [Candidatus Gallimonas sp.]